jgi:uncharacterized protein (DUF362 family)/Pyruvate/2-oxoacid:ferredoxin oxidoreductase delta subunit
LSQTVSLARCDSYDSALVEDTIRALLAPLGGLGAFVKPGQRVLVKPNLLSANPPAKAITTHPAVVAAVVRLVRECGAKPIVADSPGGGDTPGQLRRLYRETGLLALADRGEIELAWDLAAVSVSNPEGRLVKRLDIIRPAAEADVIIALPKLKTHALTTLTGATKILFGTIPGLTKVGHHATFHDPDRFGDMLLDIVAALKPALFIMDGILAMEGNGPGSHGTPRQLGALVASADPVALDLAVCRMVGVDPERVPPLRAARSRGLWSDSAPLPPLVGVPLESLQVANFALPDSAQRSRLSVSSMLAAPSFIRSFVASSLAPRPVPAAARCTGCATCARACPADAITIRERTASERGVSGALAAKRLALVDHQACIRCYCCHELCPEAAINLKTSAIGRIAKRFTSPPAANSAR